MSETPLDNQLLELAYDELDDAQAASVRAALERDREAKARFEVIRQTRETFALLDRADEQLSERARANILREARLQAAAVCEATAPRAAGASLWLPSLAAFAIVTLVALGAWFVVRPPADAPRHDDTTSTTNSGVVASGAEREEPIARLTTEPDPAPTPRTRTPLSAEPSAAEPTDTRPSAEHDDTSSRAVAKEIADADDAERAANSSSASSKAVAADAGRAQRAKSKAAESKGTAEAVEPVLDANPAPVRIAESRALGATLGSSAGVGEEQGVAMEQSAPAATNAVEPIADAAQSHLPSAIAAFEQGRFADAVTLLDTVLADASTATTRTTALYYRGLSHQRLGDHLSAIKDLQQVVDSTFADADRARFALAASLEAAGNYNEARTHLELLAAGSSSLADSARERIAAMGNGGKSSGGGGDSAAARKKARSRSNDRKSEPAKKDSIDFDNRRESRPPTELAE